MSGALAMLAVAAIGWAFASGLATRVVARGGEALQTFGVLPPPPPPPPERVIPQRTRIRRPEGAAAPPARRAKASELVAPIPLIPPPLPPPVIAARDPGVGAEATQGAAPVPGPGTGLGGVGTGTGSGRFGDGDGDGYGEETEPRWLRGRLRYADYPDALPEPGPAGVKVSLRCTIETTGRVTNCLIARSSGYPLLDRTTARLVEERFRYRPWRDGYGRAVRSTVLIDQEWGELVD